MSTPAIKHQIREEKIRKYRVRYEGRRKFDTSSDSDEEEDEETCAHDDKRTKVSRTAEIGSAYELKDRPCEVCGGAARPSEFVLCENPGCKNGGHLDCLGFEEVPASQWFCAKCNDRVPCCECGQIDSQLPLICCAYCECVGHAECFDVDPAIATSEWTCVLCRCQGCGEQGALNAPLVQCRACAYFWHLKCLTSGTGVNVLYFECDSCKMSPGQVQEKSDGAAEESQDEESDEFKNADGAQTFKYFEEDETTEQARDPGEVDDASEIGYIAWLHKLRWLKKRRPAEFYFLKKFVTKQATYDGKEDWDDFVDLIIALDPSLRRDDLDKHKVPQKLGRILKKLCPLKITTKTLEVVRNEVTFQADFHYRDLQEVVLQLFYSPTNRRRVPMHVVTDDCTARTKWGVRMVDLWEAFQKRRNTRKSDIVLPLQFFSDGTTSNFMKLHPILMSLPTFDHDGRVMNTTTSQAVVAFVPTASSLRFYRNGTQISSGQAKRFAPNVSSASILREMIKLSVKTIMNEVRVLENGVSVKVGAVEVQLYAFLYSWICDMEERRNILGLSLQPHWVCTHCYGRPSPHSKACEDPDLERLISDCCPRTFRNTKFLLKEIAALDEDPSYRDGAAKRKTEASELLASRFGIVPENDCPLSKDDNFLLDGAAAYFLCDRLHVLEGVKNRIVDMLDNVYGGSLRDASIALGNTHCATSTGMRVHKYEESLHDFQYFALALKLDFGLRVTKVWKPFGNSRLTNHTELALSFLELVTILKNDASGPLDNALELCITTFLREIEQLESDLRTVGVYFEETSKIHELTVHFRGQIEENGPCKHFSTDLGEFSHINSKEFVHFGSKRYADQGKTVLMISVYKSAFADLALDDSSLEDVRSYEPFDPIAEFTIRVPVAPVVRGKAKALLQSNLCILCRKFALGLVADELIDQGVHLLGRVGFHTFENISVFGSSACCSLLCRKRKTSIKSDMLIAVVQNDPEKRDYVLAYRAEPSESEALSGNAADKVRSARCCRYHNADCELYCSYDYLLRNTAFGWPLLFFQDAAGSTHAVVLELHPRTNPGAKNHDQVIAECEVGAGSIRIVPLDHVRTKCLTVHNRKSFHVFVCGSRVYGHSQ